MTSATQFLPLGRVGIWTFALDSQPMSKAQDAASELESLGFRTLWFPEAIGREPFSTAALLLSATKNLIVATGIASIHARTAATMQAAQKTLTEAFPDRFLLGMGVSHHHMVKALHKSVYEKPYSMMVEYLDVMDTGLFAAAPPSTPTHRVLAALGPKMLKLAATRADGAHPYFAPVEHTLVAREILGPDSILAPEQAVIFETDPTKAREIARKYMGTYTRLPNYANNLMRYGFSADDIKGADGLPSDRLVDAIVAWGTLDTISRRIQGQFDAGASHVSVQVLQDDFTSLPMNQWRELATLLPEFNR
ncbi:MAG: LLM class F420-dependent oxidoreductase [Ilumatobacteraceae bacterium]